MGCSKTAARAAVASSVHGRVQRRQQNRRAAQEAAPQPPPPPVPPAAPAPPVPAGMDDILARLTKLGELKTAGLLTEAELEAQKARVLAG